MEFYSLKGQFRIELEHFIEERHFVDRTKVEILYCSHCGNQINNQLNVHWFTITNPDLPGYLLKYCSNECVTKQYLLDRMIPNILNSDKHQR